MGGGSFPPDAAAPRSLSGVPVSSRWAATVGTYISLQGKAISTNDETHPSSSQPGLTCPNVLFMVAYPWRKNAYGRGALSSPVGTYVRSQRWRAFKHCSALLEQFTRLAGGCDLISLRMVSLLSVQLNNYLLYLVPNRCAQLILNVNNRIYGCLQTTDQSSYLWWFEQNWFCNLTENKDAPRKGEIKQPEVSVLSFCFRAAHEGNGQYTVAGVLWNRLRRRRSLQARTWLFLVLQRWYRQDSASFQKGEQDIRGHSVLPR